MFSTKYGSEKTIKTIKMMGQSYLTPFMLVVITGLSYARYSSVHVTFCGSSKPVYKSNAREKTCRVESFEHVEKFVEASHYLERRGRKAVVDRVVAFAVIICIMEQRFCAAFHPYLFIF